MRKFTANPQPDDQLRITLSAVAVVVPAPEDSATDTLQEA